MKKIEGRIRIYDKYTGLTFAVDSVSEAEKLRKKFLGNGHTKKNRG